MVEGRMVTLYIVTSVVLAFEDYLLTQIYEYDP